MIVLIALTEMTGLIQLYLLDHFKTISIISTLDLLIFSLFNTWPAIQALCVCMLAYGKRDGIMPQPKEASSPRWEWLIQETKVSTARLLYHKLEKRSLHSSLPCKVIYKHPGVWPDGRFLCKKEQIPLILILPDGSTRSVTGLVAAISSHWRDLQMGYEIFTSELL